MGQSNTKNKLEIEHQQSDELSIIRKFERTISGCNIILTLNNYDICFNRIKHYKVNNKTFHVTTIIGDNSFSGILDIFKNAIILVVDKNDTTSINQPKDCTISISKNYQSNKLNVVFLNMNNKSCAPTNTNNNNNIQHILLNKIEFDLDNINPINGKQCKEIDILTWKPPPKHTISGGRANNKSKKKKSSKKHKKKKSVKKSLKKKKTSNKKIS